MSNFTLDDIAESGSSQPDSPWIRYSVNCGPGAPGFALVNAPQVEGLEETEIRSRILERLNHDVGIRTMGVVAAQLRSSGIRVRTDISS
jgi:hypothetical protein